MTWSLYQADGFGGGTTFPLSSVITLAVGFVAFLRRLDRIKHEIMGNQQFCYLFAVGVIYHAEGQGIGPVLLQPGMDYADKHGLPCYLESTSSRNVPFYESLGFKAERTIHCDEKDSSTPVMTIMVRPPRGAPTTH